jgi:hypothetical protein
MTIIAPPKPMMIASQRRQPTFSPRNTADNAVSMNGSTK